MKYVSKVGTHCWLLNPPQKGPVGCIWETVQISGLTSSIVQYSDTREMIPIVHRSVCGTGNKTAQHKSRHLKHVRYQNWLQSRTPCLECCELPSETSTETRTHRRDTSQHTHIFHSLTWSSAAISPVFQANGFKLKGFSNKVVLECINTSGCWMLCLNRQSKQTSGYITHILHIDHQHVL